MGGHLITITSSEENAFLASMFPHGSWFWIGVKTTGKGPEWVTGEPMEYRAFFNVVHERSPAPKVFCYNQWYAETYSEACNCFMIEWDE